MMSCLPPRALLCGEHPHCIRDISSVTDLDGPLPLMGISLPADRTCSDAKCQENTSKLAPAITHKLTRIEETEHEHEGVFVRQASKPRFRFTCYINKDRGT
jgi:hypothetical protein